MTAPLELVSGRLWALGAAIPLDGTITWAAAGSGYQPLNSYLVRKAGQSLLVDTGPKLHEDLLLAQLRTLLAPGSTISVMITRAEPDCMGGLAAVAAAYDVDQILTGGSQSPYDGFDEPPGMAAAWKRRVALGKSVIVGLTLPGDLQAFDLCGGFEVIAPALRVLATFWGYHPDTRTLFTTDVFGHATMPTADSRRVIDSDAADVTTLESLRRELYAKYFWLPRANTRPMLENLRSIFSSRPVEVIAPAHGCVLRGRETVKRHYELLCEVLATARSS